MTHQKILNIKEKSMLFFIGIALSLSFATPTYAQSDAAKKEAFINNLMKKMTLNEKIAQLNLVSPTSGTGPFKTKRAFEKLQDGTAGNALSLRGSAENIRQKEAYAEKQRLHIPILSALDIIHGYKTIFPIPLGLSCSWDTTLIKATARVAAIEATAMGYNSAYSPMVDITRDPRWGRVMEGSGEDPYLGSLIAEAMVRGYQNNNLKDSTALLACVKHFALYGAAEAGRDYNTVNMSVENMLNFYLPPYKAAVDAGALSIMSSFNDINGIPATANKWLLKNLLRNKWGFKGFIVTDYNALQELVPHGYAANYEDAVVKAINAGLDMDMGSENYITYLAKLVKQGKVTEQQINTACRRVLSVKYDMGLFINPYRRCNQNIADQVVFSKEHKQLARKAVRESIVLLKNNNGVLPLHKNCKIAIVGPYADNKAEMLSMWSPDGVSDSVISIFNGLKAIDTNIKYAIGSYEENNSMMHTFPYNEDTQKQYIADAVELAKNSEVVVAVLGESKRLSGEAASMANIELAKPQSQLLQALKATGKPIVLILINGRPLALTNDINNADAIIEAWHPGSMAGYGIADVIFGDYNPSGKLTMTFPRSVGQIPIYYNHYNTGRPYADGEHGKYKSRYLDEMNSPLYPFGYGLSYTTFTYSELQLSQTKLKGTHNKLSVSVNVTNTGKCTGTETVQLYIGDPVASIVRPIKELKHFAKITLEPSETRKVTFTTTPSDLKFYNEKQIYDWESGDFNLYIGTNSSDVKQAQFEWYK